MNNDDIRIPLWLRLMIAGERALFAIMSGSSFLMAILFCYRADWLMGGFSAVWFAWFLWNETSERFSDVRAEIRGWRR